MNIVDILQSGLILSLFFIAYGLYSMIHTLMGQIDQLERHVLELANRLTLPPRFIDEPMRQRMMRQANDMRPME